jgi:hypothetical protein
MSALTIESATRHFAGSSTIREFVQSDLAVGYRHFRRVVTGERSTPNTLIRRLDQLAVARGESLELLVPDLPSPIQIGLKPPTANPSLN